MVGSTIYTELDCVAPMQEVDDSYRLAVALWQAGKFDEAHRVLQMQTDSATCAESQNLLGVLAHEQRDWSRAIACYENALRLQPDHAGVYNNLGLALQESEQLERAQSCFESAIHIDPTLRDAKNNLANNYLLQGDLINGWKWYRYRNGAQPLPNSGELTRLPITLQGVRILLLQEQGLGDHLFFLRFAPLLKQRGALLDFASDPRLHGILSRCGVFRHVFSSGDIDAREYGYILSIGDLPKLLGIDNLSSIPPPLSLVPDQERLIQLRTRLTSLNARRLIALTWSAGVQEVKRRIGVLHKAMPFELVEKMVTDTDAMFLVVQRNPTRDELKRLQRAAPGRILDFSTVNDDLDTMLALMSIVDDYVCVSNTNLYLRCGLGLRSTVFVPKPHDWRWITRNGESPWFAECNILDDTLLSADIS